MYKLVERLGGAYAKDLTCSVTHLIATNATSAKYRMAVSNGMAVVNAQWLAACCQEMRLVDERRSEYQVLPLMDCTICLSGFSADAKMRIADVIRQLGGNYEKDMSSEGVVTHLITKTPEGRKFTYAQQWKLVVVKLAWLDACQAQRYVKVCLAVLMVCEAVLMCASSFKLSWLVGVLE